MFFGLSSSCPLGLSRRRCRGVAVAGNDRLPRHVLFAAVPPAIKVGSTWAPRGGWPNHLASLAVLRRCLRC